MSQAFFTGSKSYRDCFDGAVFYCSDGRFGCHMDEFITQAVGLSQYDRLIVPGGPARLAGHTHLEPQFPSVKSDIRFLVEAHDLHRVVLIAHQGCAFYTQALGVAEDQKEGLQRIDLARAAAELHRIRPTLKIEAFYAYIRRNRLAFEEVRLGLPMGAFPVSPVPLRLNRPLSNVR